MSIAIPKKLVQNYKAVLAENGVEWFSISLEYNGRTISKETYAYYDSLS